MSLGLSHNPRALFHPFHAHLGFPFFEDAPASRGPRFSLKDTDDALLLSTDVPGLTDKDIQISFEEDVLTVTAERKATDDSAHRPYAFSKQLRVEVPIVVEASTATVKDGVLSIRLTKAKKEPNVKTIPVTGG